MLQVVAFALLNSAALVYMTALGRCRPCDGTLRGACGPGVRGNELAHIFCPRGHYNDIATLVAAPTGALLAAPAAWC